MKRKLDAVGDGQAQDDFEHDEESGDEQGDRSVDAMESKAEKNRERNREHAKRTRQRKKEMIEGMKMRLLELQREAARLEQLLEESNTANILLCMSVKPESSEQIGGMTATLAPELPPSESAEDLQAKLSRGNIIDHLRQKVRAEAAQTQREKQLEHMEDVRAQMLAEASYHSAEHGDLMIHPSFQAYSAAFKGGQAMDEHEMMMDGHDIQSGGESRGGGGLDIDRKAGMTAEDIKRERNRMHAKLTRDRKKLFTSRLQQTIQALERHNQMIRNRLHSLITSGGAPNLANASSMQQMPAPMSGPSGFRDVNASRTDSSSNDARSMYAEILQQQMAQRSYEASSAQSSPMMQGMMMSTPMGMPMMMPWALPPSGDGNDIYGGYITRRQLQMPPSSSSNNNDNNPAGSG